MKERKFSKNQLAEIRAKLMQDGTEFKCYGRLFKVSKTEFPSMDPIYAIGRDEGLFGPRMNVNKFGPTCVTVYTFDMLGNRTSGKFRYDLIEFENKEA
jgi:hypothetical protein